MDTRLSSLGWRTSTVGAVGIDAYATSMAGSLDRWTHGCLVWRRRTVLGSVVGRDGTASVKWITVCVLAELLSPNAGSESGRAALRGRTHGSDRAAPCRDNGSWSRSVAPVRAT